MALPVEALTRFIKGVVIDPTIGLPTARHLTGSWIAAEGVDGNLSQVYLPGGRVARYVPKLAHVTGLVSGDTIELVLPPGGAMYISGKLVGNITLAVPLTPDTIPPTTPAGLAAGATTTSTIALSWSASTDNVGVVAYDVYVNGIFWLTTTGTSCVVGGLANNTTYTLGVRARDAVGNMSSLTTTSGTTSTPAAPPAGTTISLSYAATWSRSFNYNNSNEYDSWYGSNCYQGKYGGGNQKSLIGFNSGQIQSDLAGASSFLYAQVKLTYAHWWANAGGTAVIGTHSNGSPPGTFGNATTNQWQSGGWTAGTTRTVAMGGGVCLGFANGSITGVCLGPGPSTSTQYYGNAYGAGSGVYQPVLTLTFVR